MGNRPSQPSLVIVTEYGQPAEAHAAKNYLAENGIRAFVAGDFCPSPIWPAFAPAQLKVLSADADRAKALLAAAHSDENAGTKTRYKLVAWLFIAAFVVNCAVFVFQVLSRP